MSHFNVSLIVWAKSQDSVRKSQFLKRKESRSGSNRGSSAYQPSALPLGHTGSQTEYGRHARYTEFSLKRVVNSEAKNSKFRHVSKSFSVVWSVSHGSDIIIIIIIITIINSLTARVIGAPQMIWQFSPFFSVLRCPLGLAELQACPFPDVVFPPFPLSALSSSPFHCALQDDIGQT